MFNWGALYVEPEWVTSDYTTGTKRLLIPKQPLRVNNSSRSGQSFWNPFVYDEMLTSSLLYRSCTGNWICSKFRRAKATSSPEDIILQHSFTSLPRILFAHLLLRCSQSQVGNDTYNLRIKSYISGLWPKTNFTYSLYFNVCFHCLKYNPYTRDFSD